MVSLFLCFGCKQKQQRPPDQINMENIGITDLAPAVAEDNSNFQRLQTINFKVYIYKLPADRIILLDQIYEILFKRPIDIPQPDSFASNYFRVALGQIDQTEQIKELLAAAGGEELRTITMMIAKSLQDELPVAVLDRRQTIFHVGNDNDIIGSTIGPGIIALELDAQVIPEENGVCLVKAEPVFEPKRESRFAEVVEKKEIRKLEFDSLRFSLKMVPGQLFLLGPTQYLGDEKTLGSLFFSRPMYDPTIRIFMVVCEEIVE